jgi:hypothetical protein
MVNWQPSHDANFMTARVGLLDLLSSIVFVMITDPDSEIDVESNHIEKRDHRDKRMFLPIDNARKVQLRTACVSP